MNVIVCGRRFGKTTLGLDALVTEPRGALEGYPVAWFAPNSKLFDEVWHEAKRVLAPITSRVDTQQNVIELITGGRIDFWTLHNTDDPGRGRKYARVFIDEAAIVPSARLARQWPEAIRPTLTDYRGDAWFASTPKGAGYFKDLFDRADGEDGWARWQMPTTANPHIDPEEVQLAKLELPTLVFAQEYEAKFVTDFGARFKDPLRYEPDELPRDGFREATGCDFAYTSKAGDWTVFLEGRIHDGILYVTNAHRVQDEINTWAPVLQHQTDPFAFIGGQEKGITQMLRQYGIRLRTQAATSDKLARAQGAIAAWNRGDIRIPTTAPWLDDILQEILSFTGDPKIDAHDDVIDALAALHHALAKPGRPDLKAMRKATGVA